MFLKKLQLLCDACIIPKNDNKIHPQHKINQKSYLF